jgi:hypothetical protein
MNPDVKIIVHTLIVGDIGTILAIAVTASALSGLGSMFSALLASLRGKKDGKIAVTLSDGTKVKFDSTMSQNEIAQKLGSISANVQTALQASEKRSD